MNVFDLYGRYYDLLYRDKDYQAEALYVAQYLRQYSPSARRVLELGCGTGAHAAALAKAGFDIFGVDISDSMLAGASRRRRELPALQDSMRFAVGDVRNFRAGETFDAVISLFHVLSYQTSNADLLDTFESARAHLERGSVFLFDFWYGPAVLTQRPEIRARELEDERIRVTRIAQPKLRENENLVEVTYNVLVEDKNAGRVERIRETHVMRYLFLPEVDALLDRMGMRRVCAKGWLTDEEPSVDSWSGFVVARKVSL